MHAVDAFTIKCIQFVVQASQVLAHHFQVLVLSHGMQVMWSCSDAHDFRAPALFHRVCKDFKALGALVALD